MWGIRKHLKGSKYDHDYLVINWKYKKTLQYHHKESAEFMAKMLSEKYPEYKFMVVMLDE